MWEVLGHGKCWDNGFWQTSLQKEVCDVAESESGRRRSGRSSGGKPQVRRRRRVPKHGYGPGQGVRARRASGPGQPEQAVHAGADQRKGS